MSEFRPDIRFYDNEENNWERDMARHGMGIQFFLVENERPNANISTMSKTFPSKIAKHRALNNAYIEHFASQGNAYASFLNTIIKSPGGDIKFLDKDYPSDGFEPYIPDLLEWSSPTGKPKYVIFDWDKTITAVEGMYFGTHEGASILNSPIRDVALFVMGGEDRLHKVHRAIHHLKTNGVGIFIITNNPNAARSQATRDIYLQLISMIFGVTEQDADSILYCAKDHGYAKWRSACAIDILMPYLNCQEEPASKIKRERPTEVAEGRREDTTHETTGQKKATTRKTTGRPATAKSTPRIGGKRTKKTKRKTTRRRRRKTKKR